MWPAVYMLIALLPVMDGPRALTDAVFESDELVTGDATLSLFAEMEAGATAVFGLGRNGVVARVTGNTLSLQAPGCETSRSDLELPNGPLALTLTVRSAACELLVDGRSALFLDADRPLAGEPLFLEARAGSVTFDDVRVTQLLWRDGVQIEGSPLAVEALANLTVAKARLLEPPPTRIDPTFRMAVKGHEPVCISVCGARESERVIPLVDQALALAGVRPWLCATVLDQSPVDLSDGDASITVMSADSVIEVRGLVGHAPGQPMPTMALLDRTHDKVLDFSIPGGPMGRPLQAAVPEECAELGVELTIPGRGKLERTLVLVRP